MATAPREVLPDVRPRLEAAGRAVQDAVDALRLARKLRDQLIVRAVDEGMSQGAVARAAGVTRTRVLAVLVESQPAQLLP